MSRSTFLEYDRYTVDEGGRYLQIEYESSIGERREKSHDYSSNDH